MVLSCNATSDHAIIWIEREAEHALEKLKDHSTETTMAPPKVQKFDRKQTIEKEHEDALERAVSLNIPNAATTTGEESSGSIEGSSSGDMHIEPCEDETENSKETKTPSSKNARTNWNEVVEKLFKRNESGKQLLVGETSVTE
ncbi:uncharacterized protein LOC111408154 isoform X2 [Olea europaea var. sylvestris]|nr:uncharacterized protein LOC111408154 isoform X2 [Olea europaea var. sylvestris]